MSSNTAALPRLAHDLHARRAAKEAPVTRKYENCHIDQPRHLFPRVERQHHEDIKHEIYTESSRLFDVSAVVFWRPRLSWQETATDSLLLADSSSIST